jgi:hypothetical protein
MKKRVGEDVDIKLKLYYEMDHADTQFSFEVEVEAGDKAETFTRFSRNMDHAPIKTGEDAEDALKLSLWDLWMVTNKKLQKVLEEMNVIPEYNPDWWKVYTKDKDD